MLPRPRVVVDVTMYNGEAIMRRRLAYLAPLVDVFVVVEASHTHSGVPKESYFLDTERGRVFAPHTAKVREVRVDAFPAADVPDDPASAAWRREAHQRDAALAALLDIQADCAKQGREMVAVVADVDEVPTAAALCALRTMMPVEPVVHLSMFFMYYSPRMTVLQPWCKAFAISDQALTPATCLTALRTMSPPVAVMPAAGFHFSFFMTPDEVRRKIESFAHREYDTDEVKTRIEANMRVGRDVFGRPGLHFMPTPDVVLRMLPPEFAKPEFDEALTR